MRIAKLVSGFFLAVAVCLLLFSQSAQAGCGFLPDGDYVCGGSGVGNGSGGGVFAPEAAPGTTLIAPDGTPLMDILGEGERHPLPLLRQSMHMKRLWRLLIKSKMPLVSCRLIFRTMHWGYLIQCL